MSTLISEINLQDNFPSIKLYHLFQTSSKEKNNEILKIFKKYPNSQNFFSYYTQSNITNILYILNEFQNNLTSIFSIPKNYESLSNIEQYITSLSKVILLLNLISKNEKIINSLLTSAKKFVLKTNINEKSILKKYINYVKNFQITEPIEIKKTKTQRLKRDLSRKSTKENTNNNIQYLNNTPKFKEINHIRNNSNDEKTLAERKNSIISFANMVIINEPQLNNIRKIKRNKTYYSMIKKPKRKINIKEDNSHLSCPNIKIFDKTKMCSDLLEIVNQLYKNCIINSEEKIRIKQLILSKNKKIEEIYFRVYNDNNMKENIIGKFFIEFKKIL